MLCFVYRSARCEGAYVYLRERDGFGRLPADLRARLEPLERVLDLELTPGRRLARADSDEVRAALARDGFHLQLPPPVARSIADGR